MDRIMEEFFNSERGNHRADVFWIMEKWVDIPKGSKVLEIGGRNEPLAEWLHQKGYDVTVIDLEPDSTCNYLPKRSHKWVVGDFLREWKNIGEFDAIISCSAIEHFGFPKSADEHREVREVRDNMDDYIAMLYSNRILKKDGLLYLTVPVVKVYKVVNDDWRCYDKENLSNRLLAFWIVNIAIYFNTDMTKNKSLISEDEAFSTEQFERDGNTCMLRLRKNE